MDVETTSVWLDATKAVVADAIRQEVQRALRANRRRIRLNLTRGMVAPLENLYAWAYHEGLREMGRLGIGRLDSTPMVPGDAHEAIRPVVMRLAVDLQRLEGRVERDVRDGGMRAGAGQAIGSIPSLAAKRLASVPGALEAASYLVTPAYAAGLEDVYKANADLFGGYLYSAVLDRGTCTECRSKDGREYPTLAEAEVDLPGFGPNPSCRGGSRCRCRLVPLPPEGSVGGPRPAPTPPAPAAPEPAPVPEAVPTFKTADEATRWIESKGYAKMVSMPGFTAPALQEVAEAIHDTLGRFGVTLERLETMQKSRKGTNAVFSRRRAAESEPGTIELAKAISSPAKAAKRAEQTDTNYQLGRAMRMAERRNQVADTARPDYMRENAAQALTRLEASERWSMSSVADRPLYATTVHEAGHAIDYAYGLQARFAARVKELQADDRLDGLRVSEYATTNDAERFAETFSAYIQGVPIPESHRAAMEEVLRAI